MACLEEISYTLGYITREQLIELAQPLKKNAYGQYLLRLAKSLEKHNEPSSNLDREIGFFRKDGQRGSISKKG